MMRSILAILLAAFAVEVHATHLIGGEMYYEYLQDDEYRVYLKLYRDCSSSNSFGTDFDQRAAVTIFDNENNVVEDLFFFFNSRKTVEITINDPCYDTPQGNCVEEGLYYRNVTLPPITGGYTITFQRCCRTPALINIANPSITGSTFTCTIPDKDVAQGNSMPHQANDPPVALCIGSQAVIDLSAVDPDGDSLVYEFCTPYRGASQNNAAPSPADPPPYNLVNWAPGFSAANPIPGAPAFQIDPNTGRMTGSPTTAGLYVVGVCTREYRDGKLLSENKRDYLFYVQSCVSNVRAIADPQREFCKGNTVTFTHSSLSTKFYHWDFGVAGTNADTSNLSTPTYTFIDTGLYNIRFIANPGWSCADTDYISYRVYPELNMTFPSIEGQCFQTNSFDFKLYGVVDTGAATYSWSFGPLASTQSSSQEEPQNIRFLDTGMFLVQVDVEQYVCKQTLKQSLIIYPEPIFDFNLSSNEGCVPLHLALEDRSFAWTDIEYQWNLGNGERSVLNEPRTIYDKPGNYDLSLYAYTTEGCRDTGLVTLHNAVTVHPRPRSSFSLSNDSGTVFEPAFDIIDNSLEAQSCLIYFSKDEVYDQCGGSFEIDEPGDHLISQVVFNEFGCSDTSFRFFRINEEFKFFVPNTFTPNKDGMNEVFKPVVQGVSFYLFIVEDRWGREVFRTVDTREGWDGKGQRSGLDMDDGVYVYRVVLKDYDNDISYKVGTVNLVR